VPLFCYLLPKDGGAPHLVCLSSETLEYARWEAARLLGERSDCFAAEIWTHDGLLTSFRRDGVGTPEAA
jgi:hypothetical protein